MKTRKKYNGSTQATRLPRGLENGYFQLDDRSEQDMIVAAHQYAGLLRYFNLKNEAEDDWTCFWKADYITLLASIAALDVDEIRRQYEAIDTAFGEALEDYNPDEDPGVLDPSPVYYKELLQKLRDMAARLEQQYLDLKATGLPLSEVLLQLIRRDNCCDDQELQGALSRLIRLHKAGDDQLSYTAYAVFFTDDNRWGVPNKKAYDGLMAAADLDREQLRALFITLYNTFVYLKSRAQQAYDEALALSPQVHPPHIALFLTFLKLFKYLQDDLNDLTSEHLNYYYEKVLGFERRPAQPDQAYLVFTLAKEFNQYMVEEGTMFLAGKENNRPIFFETLRNWSLSQAKVEAAKMVMMNVEGSRIVLSAEELILGSSAGGSDTSAGTAGTTNTAIPLSETEKETGFIIASPQLLLREGNRKIIVKISNVNDIPISAIYLSTKEQWSEKIEVEKVTASIDEILSLDSIEKQVLLTPVQAKYNYNNTNKNLVFEILIRRDFPGIEPIDSGKAISTLPCIKFVINTANFNSDGDITNAPAISISVGADHLSKSLILQNDLGVFNGTQQLLPFGPMALQHANFFLGSDEALTKRLKYVPNSTTSDEIKITIDWLGKLIGGNFTKHYASYSTAPDGRVSLKYLKDGKFEGNQIQSIIPGGSTTTPTGISVKASKRSVIVDDPINKFLFLKLPIDQAHPEDEPREKSYQAISKYDSNVNRGFLQISFEGDFLHDIYAKELAIQSTEMSNGVPQNIEAITLLQHIGLLSAVLNSDENHLNNQINIIADIINESPFSQENIIERLSLVHQFLGKISTDNTRNGGIISSDIQKALEFTSSAAERQTLSAVSSNLPLTAISTQLSQILTIINNQVPVAEIIQRLITINTALKATSDTNAGKIAGIITNHQTAFEYFSEKILAAKDLPNPPFTPTFNAVSLGYTSQDQIMEEGVDEFYFTYPFGGYQKKSLNTIGSGSNNTSFHFLPTEFWLYQQAAWKKRDRKNYLYLKNSQGYYYLPEYIHKTGTLRDARKVIVTQNIYGGKHLYIGLSQLLPNSSLSLFFKMEEGSGDQSSEPPEVSWYFFGANQEWLNFLPDEIILDQTRGLKRTGVIEFSIPNDMGREGNTLLDPNLYWLRVTAEETNSTKVSALPTILDIRAQAIEVRFHDEKIGVPEHLAAPLPAFTISKLAVSQAAVKKIEQPLPSFNGRLPESAGKEFYQRVSERLRHKDRAITPWDYERLLLEQYPLVAKTLCVSHATMDGANFSACKPGSVLVAVIPDLHQRTRLSPEPRFSKGDLDEMRDFLIGKTNLFLDTDHVKVQNPHYEPVFVKASITLRKGYSDKAYYKLKADSDLKQFLSPWMFDASQTPAFSSILRKSEVLKFLEQLPYVDVVKDFGVFTGQKKLIQVSISTGQAGQNITLNAITIEDVQKVLDRFPGDLSAFYASVDEKIVIHITIPGNTTWAKFRDYFNLEIQKDTVSKKSPISILTTVNQTGDETDHDITIL